MGHEFEGDWEVSYGSMRWLEGRKLKGKKL